MTTVRGLALAAIVAGGTLAAAPTAASAMPDALGLQVWSDSHQRGIYRNLFGPQIMDLGKAGMDDKISSFKANGSKWCLYADTNLRQLVKTADAGEYVADLDGTGFNDRISSVARC
ncbi:hypothetical protein [Paractinoplanes hotanensis]|uniref:Uncharacterized protein n=1 Tax=Paractinoplanes hotanensis TaxID=2906497 RepID=A0ABT0YCX2_9ACTN|nr:hypothetical protein [Actinoplanes hotanensis]MCM4083600.1 hypothetical protein [Actinoplanes hotanensis]